MSQSGKSSRGKSGIWIILVLCLSLGIVAYYFLNQPSPSETATELLIEPQKDASGEEEPMTHVVDEATEFEQSLNYLKDGVAAPRYRETASARKVVPSDPASITIDPEQIESAVGISVDLPQKVEPKAPVERKIPEGIELPPGANAILQFNRDWEGVVLVPDNVKLARAYTTHVAFSRIEAHPLEDGRIRVWSRIENLTGRTMDFQTACEFRFLERRAVLTGFRSITIPEGSAVDVSYESMDSGVNAYTLMVNTLIED